MTFPVINVTEPLTATIASSGSLSAEADLHGRVLCGIVMPAAWTAAALTFQASWDGSTFYELFDDQGDAVTSAAAASSFIAIQPATWFAIRKLKVRSGTTGTPVAQAAERDITLIVGNPNKY